MAPSLLPSPETIGRMVDAALNDAHTSCPGWLASRDPETARRDMAHLVIERLRAEEWQDRPFAGAD